MMSSKRCLSSALTAITLSAIVLPFSFSQMASAQKTFFSDVSSTYWAKPFIERLSREGVITGFTDGTFRPEQPVTRAQFAVILRNAFSEESVRKSRSFKDVPTKYWAAAAIDKAYTTGFMSGYADNTFRPEQKITKSQTLVYLANGLQLSSPKRVKKTLSIYRDASEITEDTQNSIAAATENSLVVNYPKATYLSPTAEVTRADVAAAIYQALVQQGKLPALPADSKAVAYIVNYGKGQTFSEAGTSSNSSVTASNLSNGLTVTRGTPLYVRLPGGNEVKLIVASSDTVQTNLEVAQSVTNARGTVIIPVGSRIQGRFQPATINGTAGTQYVADKLVINNKTYDINVASDPLAPTAKQSLSPGSISGGLATIAGQLLLGRILGGGTDVGSILGGVLGGGNNQPLGGLLGGGDSSPLGGLLGGGSTTQSSGVIVIEPSKLVLRLQSDFQ